MKFLGKQYFVELYGCMNEKLDDQEFIANMMVQAALEAKATVVQQFFHQFSPYGVSGTVVIAESHINIHTWPEHNYAAVDIFTCGEELEPDAAISYLKKSLEANEVEFQEILRGSTSKIDAMQGAKQHQ